MDMNVIYGLRLKDDDLYPIRYVGLTSRGVSIRFSEHCRQAQVAETPLYRWMRKYGTENVEYIVIEELDDPLALSDREIYWIDQLGTYIGDGKLGLNATRGGLTPAGYAIMMSSGRVSTARCQTCRLPVKVRQYVERNRAKAKCTSYPALAAWLVERGYNVHFDTLRNHFRAGHHLM